MHGTINFNSVTIETIGKRSEQVAANGQVLAEGANFGVEGTAIDQAAHVLLAHQWNTLKHINILDVGQARTREGSWLGSKQGSEDMAGAVERDQEGHSVAEREAGPDRPAG